MIGLSSGFGSDVHVCTCVCVCLCVQCVRVTSAESDRASGSVLKREILKHTCKSLSSSVFLSTQHESDLKLMPLSFYWLVLSLHLSLCFLTWAFSGNGRYVIRLSNRQYNAQHTHHTLHTI